MNEMHQKIGSKLELEMLQMSLLDFDQSPNGWRKIDSKKNHLKAAKLIQKYILRNKVKILKLPSSKKNIDVKLMYFHIGQLLASAGTTHWSEAIKAFKKAFRKNDDLWNAHVSATIGFLGGSINKIDDAIHSIESSRKKDKRTGYIKVTRNLRMGLSIGLRDYEKVASLSPKKLMQSWDKGQ